MNNPALDDLKKEGVEGAKEPFRGNVKYKLVKAYGPSLRKLIHDCQNLEDFEALWAEIKEMVVKKMIPQGSVNKLNKLGKTKHAELSAQKILRPVPKKLIVPGLLIPRKGEGIL